jgi:transmembrane sensor
MNQMPIDERNAESPEELQKQARVWLRVLDSGDVKAWDAQAFQRWLRTSAAHKEAFNEVKRRWDLMKPATGELLRSRPEVAAFHRRTLYRSPVGRRAFLGATVGAGAVAVAAAAVGLAVMHPPLALWPGLAEWRADYRTAVGEQRTLALADQIDVTLNTRTSVRRQTAGGETVGLDLIDGEAAIDLRGAGRSFLVAAGSGRSVAGSGRFEVRYLDGKVCVTCIDGAVKVEHPAGARLLQARQQTVYDIASIGGVAGIDPAAVSAWRNGELVFNQARLSEVVEEINRYRSGRVVLMNAAARSRPVSGRFLIGSLDSALSQLQHTFDLNMRSLPGGVLILS